MLLNDKLNDNDDIMKQMRGLYARANSVLRKFALLKSNLDCFKLFAQVSIVPICGINLPNRLCPRSEAYNNFFRLLFGYRRSCSASEMEMFVTNDVYITLNVVCENILVILLCGLAAAVIS